eukprot:87972_1
MRDGTVDIFGFGDGDDEGFWDGGKVFWDGDDEGCLVLIRVPKHSQPHPTPNASFILNSVDVSLIGNGSPIEFPHNSNVNSSTLCLFEHVICASNGSVLLSNASISI